MNKWFLFVKKRNYGIDYLQKAGAVGLYRKKLSVWG